MLVCTVLILVKKAMLKFSCSELLVFLITFFLGCVHCQDLPEYFEDHMSEWMEGFAKLLEFKYDALVDADEELTPGKLKILLTP